MCAATFPDSEQSIRQIPLPLTGSGCSEQGQAVLGIRVLNTIAAGSQALGWRLEFHLKIAR